jgi:hypothetical protein
LLIRHGNPMFSFTWRPSSCTIRCHVTQTVEMFHVLRCFDLPHSALRTVVLRFSLSYFLAHSFPLHSTFQLQLQQPILSIGVTLLLNTACYARPFVRVVDISDGVSPGNFVRTYRYLYSVQHFVVCGACGTNINSESNWVSFLCIPTESPAKFRYSVLNYTKTASFYILFNLLATLNQPFGTV